MIKYVKNIFIILSIILISISCNQMKQIDKAIELFNKKEYQSAFFNMSDAIVEYANIGSIKDGNIYIGNNIVLTMNADIEMIHPNEYTLRYNRDIISVSYDKAKERIAITDGNNIFIYQEQKLLLKVDSPTGDPIKSLALNGDYCYVLSGVDLYIFDLTKKIYSKVQIGKFSIPFNSKYYNVYMYIKNKRLIITIGIAGVYNLYVYSMVNNDFLINKRQVSSWKNGYYNNTIYYIKGVTGNWKLCKYDIKNKSDTLIKKFDNVQDIFFYNEKVFVYTNKKMYYYNGKEIHSIPILFEIIHNNDEVFIVNHKNKKYILDGTRLVKSLNYIMQKTNNLQIND